MPAITELSLGLRQAYKLLCCTLHGCPCFTLTEGSLTLHLTKQQSLQAAGLSALTCHDLHLPPFATEQSMVSQCVVATPHPRQETPSV